MNASESIALPKVKTRRIDSIDLLRGIIMVLMALDHVRDYFTNVRYDPLDLSQTDGFLFMTRWITHFCAPVFVFLAGTGAFLSLSRGKTKPELSKFLLTRGIWLIILEITIVRFGWVFNFDYSFLFMQVIWVIGCSMVILSVMIFLSIRSIAVIGISIILIHNAFDFVLPQQLGIFGWPWIFLHEGGILIPFTGLNIYIAYPLIPWIGVMAAGFAFGSFMKKNEDERKKIFIRLGVSLTFTFIILRALNIYGDPNPWTIQDTFWKTVLSFINCWKYPPSLLYLLMTLGPAILSLAYIDKLTGWIHKFFLTFGRVPLFYYLLHIPLAHLLAVIAALISGVNIQFMFSNEPPWLWPAGWGFDLAIIYLFWIAVVLSLYPISLWFANLKQRRKDKWLSYL